MLKLLLGLLLLPASVGALLAGVLVLGDVAAATRMTLPFLLGFFGYPLLHFRVIAPRRLYVWGHELTHAVAAWLSGASVLGLVVGRKGGHVDLSHSSAAIALAPYVFPFYAVVMILLYRLFLWAVPVQGFWERFSHGTFLCAMGMALSFHAVHTMRTLWEVKQPDLGQAGGTVFSLAVIALLNGVFLILILKCLFPDAVVAERSLKLIWRLTLGFWQGVFSVLENFLQHRIHRIEGVP